MTVETRLSVGRRPWRAWTARVLAASTVLVLLSAAAIAAVETHTVPSFWRGMWWSLSLLTTVGFTSGPPTSGVGQVLSAVLMVAGFVLLALASAAMTALFVREDEQPFEDRTRAVDEQVLLRLDRLAEQLDRLENGAGAGPASPPTWTTAPGDLVPRIDADCRTGLS